LAKVAVLTGNGLSIALNPEFSIPRITEKFFIRLNPEHRAFIEHHISANTNKSNFEECIASIETLYDALHTQLDFFNNEMYGSRFVESHGLDLAAIQKHEKSIRASIELYMALILEIVDRNVQMQRIRANIPNFVKWLNSVIKADNDVDLFTLNYDLLLETIMLSFRGVNYMNFFYPTGAWFGINEDRSISMHVHRHYFDPDKALKKRKDHMVRVYHLHGSLASFKDMKNKRIFTVKTDVIREHSIYKRIAELNIVPSIITGGRKSLKIQEEPFRFYYKELMEMMSNEDRLCDELYIVGYSFSDEHINHALIERFQRANRSVNPRPVKVVIVDYAKSAEDKANFIKRINEALGGIERFVDDDLRVKFGGANSII
jgi:hypothetical protein